MAQSDLDKYRDTMLFWYYGLAASWALAVVATFLFACTTLAHLILLFIKRSWFMIPLIIGALCESSFT
jgi:hypothetical protein